MGVCVDIYTYWFDTILSKKVNYVLCCTCTLNDFISIPLKPYPGICHLNAYVEKYCLLIV